MPNGAEILTCCPISLSPGGTDVCKMCFDGVHLYAIISSTVSSGASGQIPSHLAAQRLVMPFPAAES